MLGHQLVCGVLDVCFEGSQPVLEALYALGARGRVGCCEIADPGAEFCNAVCMGANGVAHEF